MVLANKRNNAIHDIYTRYSAVRIAMYDLLDQIPKRKRDMIARPAISDIDKITDKVYFAYRNIEERKTRAERLQYLNTFTVRLNKEMEKIVKWYYAACATSKIKQSKSKAVFVAIKELRDAMKEVCEEVKGENNLLITEYEKLANSDAEFVRNAAKMADIVCGQSVRATAKFRAYRGDFIARILVEIMYDCYKANGIYIKDKKTFTDRNKLLYDAAGRVEDVLVELGVLVQTHSMRDDTLKRLSDCVMRQKALLDGVMKSDERRYDEIAASAAKRGNRVKK